MAYRQIGVPWGNTNVQAVEQHMDSKIVDHRHRMEEEEGMIAVDDMNVAQTKMSVHVVVDVAGLEFVYSPLCHLYMPPQYSSDSWERVSEPIYIYIYTS